MSTNLIDVAMYAMTFVGTGGIVYVAMQWVTGLEVVQATLRSREPGLVRKFWVRLAQTLGRKAEALGWFDARLEGIRKRQAQLGQQHNSPGDFLGQCFLLAIVLSALALLGMVAFGAVLLAVAGFMVALLCGFQMPYVMLGERAATRLAHVNRRLPYMLDLLVLAMEAGAEFDEALRANVREGSGNPLAEELTQVLRDRDLGRTQRESFEAMATRLDSEDVNALVLALNLGDKLGTPIISTMREQAYGLRLKRTQRAERLAGEARPKMALPTTIIMAANVLLILGPFLYKILKDGLF